MSAQKFLNKATIEFGKRIFGPKLRKEPTTLKESYAKFKYYQTSHHKYGLLEHDRMWDGDKKVSEAVRRLRISEPEVYDERGFRISRSINFDLKKMYLPQDEWTTYENDVPYLQPFLDEIEREQAETKHWKKVLG
ncbi:unnamed protein product [Didymodactylos carnosus]|uniref:Cytochrome b-c1 complex subunit 7 n=1 Tax=Didymodactylos carnosus TaxID=1234261 RepID=A0A813T5T8_9BILA|nr:unnamed protein product [Didymodactylos carnosus]CAF0805143.1 unnamed protein product [Didymodactylos carnosus]CAF3532148.1 unnamed protein product [Didymodactylos carnosus]CAF3590491.1 unnamed protein product [Didymodactylos carnosus]